MTPPRVCAASRRPTPPRSTSRSSGTHDDSDRQGDGDVAGSAAKRAASRATRGAELAAQAAAIPAVDPGVGDRHRDPLPLRGRRLLRVPELRSGQPGSAFHLVRQLQIGSRRPGVLAERQGHRDLRGGGDDRGDGAWGRTGAAAEQVVDHRQDLREGADPAADDRARDRGRDLEADVQSAVRHPQPRSGTGQHVRLAVGQPRAVVGDSRRSLDLHPVRGDSGPRRHAVAAQGALRGVRGRRRELVLHVPQADASHAVALHPGRA